MRLGFDKWFRAAPRERPISDSDYSLQMWHLPPDVQQHVSEWFAGRVADFRVDGSRSVLLPGGSMGAHGLKIKGAGFNGGKVRLGVAHRTGPRAPVFDFEGRMMEDVAAGHDNAPSGGASFQQAVTEYQVSARLAKLGYPCVPCLGFGRISQEGMMSWFSVFEWHEDWASDLHYPRLPADEFSTLSSDVGALIVELATLHDLIGYAWYARGTGTDRLIKDVHPFRLADSLNMSQLSWVMQVYFALHIVTNSLKGTARKYTRELPGDFHLAVVKSFCPEVALEDHEAVRSEVVAPYMIGPPADFSPQRLLTALHGNAITRSLLASCPSRFTRF